MEDNMFVKHVKSENGAHFNVAPAPAGGTEFDFDRSSSASTSSMSSGTLDDSCSFHTVKELDSSGSFEKSLTADLNSSVDEVISSDADNSCVGKSENDEEDATKSSPMIPETGEPGALRSGPTAILNSSGDEVITSDADKSCVENSENNEEDVTKSSPMILETEESSASRSGSKNLVDESQIIQTLEYLDTKAETDRAKRFEYLLEKTEFWGHFLKPAYQEALGFETTSNGLPESESSTAEGESSQGSSSRKGSKKGRKKVAPLFSMPDMSNVKQGLGGEQPDYITSFKDSPDYIQGGTMRDYQVRGLNWMISLYEKGLSGILADEMGLGKTVQTISLLGYLKHYRDIKGPHLIIAPKSTLPNWMNELNRWCPSLKSICLIGSKEDRPSLIKNTFLPKRWNVCVTSYEMARIEKSTLSKVNYHYIVIDEAQKIKNENSLLSTCVRQFNSAVRLLLTGTPLQNNLHELWALLNFLLPDVFSSSEDFDSWFNETNCIGNQTLVDRLHGVLRPFLLRRIKSDVEKSLPPKTEMRLYVQMTPMQREWYRKILLNDIEVIVDSETGRTSKRALHNIIMHLRKCCNHPYLFEGAEPKPFTTDSHLVTNSGKMIVLDKLLLKLKAQNSRVLLFSQMTRMLDILEDYCIWRNFEYCRLDGQTEYDIRQEDIDAFNAPNSSKFIYLLSTRAGGLGINLASANIVIIYDSDWNPQMDLQAMDRAHRIGQTKQVNVFRFVVQDTAEEKIIERAAAKLHLDRMVIQQGRLVGADSNKGPNVVEMLSVVRFGAEKILKTGPNEGISDADIDTILAQSKKRSEEMDRRLNGMNEDNLRDLTIEQVELKWEKPMTAKDDNSTFNFEGKNYRELRKRKTISQDTSVNLMEGKRRKGAYPLQSDDDEEKDDVSDSLFVPGDDEYVSSSGENEMKTLSKSKVHIQKPKMPLDFRFSPPYIWELYWRQVDVYQKRSGQNQLDQIPEDLLLQDLMLLKTAEGTRLKKCDELNSIELRELNMLKFEGFSSWKKKHFDQFLSAMKKHGPDNLESVAKEISRKEVEEVVQYSQVFWMKCHELGNFEELMELLGRPSLVTDRRKHQQNLLDEKIMQATIPSELAVQYDPHHWIGQRFSKEDDVQLLLNISEIGMLTCDVFGSLRSKLMQSRNGVSAFLRTRSKEELRTRFNLLIYMIEKELVSSKNDTPSTPVGPVSKVNTPRAIARAKKTMIKQVLQKASSASPKVTKSGTPRKSKLPQVDESKADD